jgi:hypothetical protein
MQTVGSACRLYRLTDRQTVPNECHEGRGDISDVTHKQPGRTSRAVPGYDIITDTIKLHYDSDNQGVAKTSCDSLTLQTIYRYASLNYVGYYLRNVSLCERHTVYLHKHTVQYTPLHTHTIHYTLLPLHYKPYSMLLC